MLRHMEIVRKIPFMAVFENWGTLHARLTWEDDQMRWMRLVALAVVVALAGGMVVAGDDDTPKKGKFKGKFKGKGDAKDAAGDLFKKIDTDKDGKISKKELKKFMEDKGGKGVDVIDKIFERLDKDEDGYLSKDEFKKVAERFAGKAKGGKSAIPAKLLEKLKGLKGGAIPEKLKEKLKERGIDLEQLKKKLKEKKQDKDE